MTSRRLLPPLALALGVLLAAAACSPSASSSASPLPSSPAATAAATPAGSSTSPIASLPAGASPASSRGGWSAFPGAPAALECTPPASPTTSQTEGPYYRPGAPQRGDLVEPGMGGTVLVVTGFVVDTECTPLANAKVDVWQADASGAYDNSGYRLRGYVLTDAEGRYTFRTVVPGEYPGRTEHIHVKVTPDGGATLTSQLYFPGSTANEGDSIFSPDLLLDIAEGDQGLVGTFTFVVEE